MLTLTPTEKTEIENLLAPARDEARKKIASQRVAAEAAKKALEAKAGKAWVDLSKEIDAAQADLETARAALKNAQARVIAANAARSKACAKFSREIEAIEASLIATADVAITVFIGQMRDELEKTLRMAPPENGTVIVNILTGRKSVEPGRAVVLPRHRAHAIREAIASAEALKLVANQTDVAEKIARLRSTLPTVGAAIE